MFLRMILFLFLFLSGQAYAEKVPSPLRIEGGRVISVEEAKAFLTSGKALFIDVRNPLNYGRSHIPSAIPIPFDSKNAGAPEKSEFIGKLPSEKGTGIIFYSHGPSGWKSYRAALEAVKAGYTNVLWLRDGLEGWTAKGYSVAVGHEADPR